MRICVRKFRKQYHRTKIDAHKTVERVLKAARSVVFGTFVTILIAVVGVLASLFYDEIKRSWPFVWPTGDWTVNWIAVSFWFAMLLVAFGFAIRQYAIDQAQAALQKKLSESINSFSTMQTEMSDRQEGLQGTLSKSVDELMHAVRTMPDQGYLAKQADFIDECEDIVWRVRTDDFQPEATASAIRRVLLRMSELAQDFDKSVSAEYSANIMVRHKVVNRSYGPTVEEMNGNAQMENKHVSDLSEMDLEDVKQLLLFADPGFVVNELSDVLVLRRDLTATTKSPSANAVSFALEDTAQDVSIEAIALGIPRIREQYSPEDGSMRSLVLPGAATAWVKDDAVYCANTLELRSLCRQEHGFNSCVADALYHYFADGHGRSVRSFVSFPLYAPPGNDEVGEDAFGVMNIHSIDTNMLAGGDSLRLFVSSIYPLVLPLCRLLMGLRLKENPVGKWLKVL